MNIHCQQALLTHVDVRQIAAETGPVLFLRQPPYVDVRCLNATLGLYTPPPPIAMLPTPTQLRRRAAGDGRDGCSITAHAAADPPIPRPAWESTFELIIPVFARDSIYAIARICYRPFVCHT